MAYIEKVFSNYESGENLYSVIMDEEEYALFSESKKKHKIGLDSDLVNSHRGLGRSLGIGLITGGALPTALGGYIGKKVAEDADEDGLSDSKIKRKATLAGGLSGAALGGLSGLAFSKKYAPIAALGAGVGGAWGANKNTRVRLKKRKDLEDLVNKKKH